MSSRKRKIVVDWFKIVSRSELSVVYRLPSPNSPQSFFVPPQSILLGEPQMPPRKIGAARDAVGNKENGSFTHGSGLAVLPRKTTLAHVEPARLEIRHTWDRKYVLMTAVSCGRHCIEKATHYQKHRDEVYAPTSTHHTEPIALHLGSTKMWGGLWEASQC